MKLLREIVEHNNAIHASIHTNEHVDTNSNFEYNPAVISNDPFNEIFKQIPEDELHDSLMSHYHNISKKITNPELHHIMNYTDDSEDLNRYHWNGRKNPQYHSPEIHEEATKHLDKALSRVKTPHDLTVYSGTFNDPRRRKNKEGLVHHPAYLSTSINKEKAEEFSCSNQRGKNYHVLKINVPKGHKGFYIGEHSHNPGEKEFLLPRGLNLRHIKSTSESVENSLGKAKAYVHHMEIA